MMTLVILGLVVFEFLLESLEHHLHHHKGRFHQRLLQKSFKQLMILGTISFVLFILKDQKVYDQEDEVLSNTFDFVNLFLFFVGIALMLAALLLAVATTPIKARWGTFAIAPLPRLLALHSDMTSLTWTWYASWPPRILYGIRRAQVLQYHLFRSVFLRVNRSLLTPAFNFSMYSAATVNELIIALFDVGWVSWLLAILALFVTLPFALGEDGGQPSPEAAIYFGVALLALECITCAYVLYAHHKIVARIGVVGGFGGLGNALEELWVEPLHFTGQETSAIDVKELLAAAPVNPPTLEQLTSEVNVSASGASRAAVNFKPERSQEGKRSDGGGRTRGTSSVDTVDTTDGGKPSASTTPFSAALAGPTAPAGTTATVAVRRTICPENGSGCAGCRACEPMWLPPGRVDKCSMGGDPFVLKTIRPSVRAVDRLPVPLKGFNVEVGSWSWFRALFGTCTLLKCYYCAFYVSYMIGRGVKADKADAVMWTVVTLLPLLLCLLPLAKLTLPLYAQLSCLQGQIAWEIVSDIEERQDMAIKARTLVLSKLQERFSRKAEQYGAEEKTEMWTVDRRNTVSPRSRAMKDLFVEWDVDGSGEISREELGLGLAKIGVFLSSIELKELFRLADPDHSKSIDLKEFREFLADVQSLDAEPMRLQQKLEHRLQRFSARLEQQRSVKMEETGLLVRQRHSVSLGPRESGSVGAAGDHNADQRRHRWSHSGSISRTHFRQAPSRPKVFDEELLETA